LIEHALALNPHAPGWYHMPHFFYHYRKHEFQSALICVFHPNRSPIPRWLRSVVPGQSDQRFHVKAISDPVPGGAGGL